MPETLGPRVDQRAKLRRLIGHQTDTALVTDDLLDDCLDEALREVNRYWPVIGVGSFPTVAKQQVYTVALNTEDYRVRRVFWPQCDVGDAALGSGFGLLEAEILPLLGEVDENGVRRSFSPASMQVLLRRREYLERWFVGGGAVEYPNTVYLDPVPTLAGASVYFTFSKRRYDDVIDVQDNYGRQYWTWAKKTGHESLAAGCGAVTTVRGPTGLSITTRTSQAHEALAQRLKDDFMEMVPPLLPSRYFV